MPSSMSTKTRSFIRALRLENKRRTSVMASKRTYFIKIAHFVIKKILCSNNFPWNANLKDFFTFQNFSWSIFTALLLGSSNAFKNCSSFHVNLLLFDAVAALVCRRGRFLSSQDQKNNLKLQAQICILTKMAKINVKEEFPSFPTVYNTHHECSEEVRRRLKS